MCPFHHLAPCQPQGAQVSLECSSNVALVKWENSGPDQIQVVTAVDSRGVVTTCNSSSSNCTFSQLSCGERYAVSVVGHTATCSSQPAVAEAFYTGSRSMLCSSLFIAEKTVRHPVPFSDRSSSSESYRFRSLSGDFTFLYFVKRPLVTGSVVHTMVALASSKVFPSRLSSSVRSHSPHRASRLPDRHHRGHLGLGSRCHLVHSVRQRKPRPQRRVPQQRHQLRLPQPGVRAELQHQRVGPSQLLCQPDERVHHCHHRYKENTSDIRCGFFCDCVSTNIYKLPTKQNFLLSS